MPIRINLLAEAQAAEEARRRDPVKRVTLLAGLLIVAMMLWGVWEFTRTLTVKAELSRQEKAWKAIETDYAAVAAKEKLSDEIERKLSALTRLSTNRFLWGSTLNALQQCSVDPIQVTRLAGTHTYAVVDPIPPKKDNNRTIPGRPGRATEKIALTVEAKDFGNAADQNFLKFKDAIFNVPYFKNSLLTPDAIQLKNLGQPMVDANDNRSYTPFVLECAFPPKERDE